MFPFCYKVRFLLQGNMPERALLRLRREKIALYRVQKLRNDCLSFSVQKKDCQKVFAIYQNLCYNIGDYSPYKVTCLGAEGVGKWIELAKKRTGFVVGAALFCLITAQANDLVFGVQFIGSEVYAREAYMALDECGIALGKKYRKKNADLFCAKLLSLPDVEYCSIRKSGLKLQIEIRLSSFERQPFESGVMLAKRTGVIYSQTILRGTALKKIGDSVQVGDPIVGNYFTDQEGGQVRVELIARVCIACTYEAEIITNEEQIAFANAYMQAGLKGEEEITSYQAQKTEKGFLVTLCYLAVESMNM